MIAELVIALAARGVNWCADSDDGNSVMCMNGVGVRAFVLPRDGGHWHIVWVTPGDDVELPGPTGTTGEIADVLAAMGAL